MISIEQAASVGLFSVQTFALICLTLPPQQTSKVPNQINKVSNHNKTRPGCFCAKDCLDSEDIYIHGGILSFLLVVVGCSGLHCAILGCTWLYWSVLVCIWLHWVVLGSTWLFWNVVDCTGLQWTVLGYTGLWRAVLGCSGLYWAILDCIVLY